MRHSRSCFLHLFIGRPFLRVMLLTGILAVFPSCRQETEPQGDHLLARAYDSRLYLSDIRGIVPPSATAEDSLQIVRSYVENWVRQQVFLHRALESLPREKMDFEKQISDYRNSLIVFAFENELVKSQLDTTVTERQVMEYYEDNQNSFRLQDHIVQVTYVKVPLDAPDMQLPRRLYRSEDPGDMMLLEDYCLQHAAGYFMEPDTWLLFTELLRDIPITAQDHEQFLRTNRHVELTDDFYRYFLNIRQTKLKGEVSPLAMEQDNVRSILMNRRKHALINRLRNEYYQEALSTGKFETRY